MHEFLVTYLRMLKKCSKIKVLPFVEQIKADTLEAHTFFKRYRKAGDIQDDLDILERVVSLLTSSESMIYLDYFVSDGRFVLILLISRSHSLNVTVHVCNSCKVSSKLATISKDVSQKI